MDICIASDDNYSSIMTVVISSILENNKKVKNIVLHIFEDNISKLQKELINNLVKKYNRYVIFYDVNDAISKLERDLNNDWANRNSYVCYIRLFMPLLLDSSVKRFLYLDCDTLVTGYLEDLFNLEMGNNVIAAVKDVLPYKYKLKIGLESNSYFNSGILLVDKHNWLKNDTTNKLLEYCRQHQDDAYPDQDAINVVLANKIMVLLPKYCVFYPEYSWKPAIQYWGYGNRDLYYTPEELLEAHRNPVIIHYTDTIWGRPWQSNNINPYSKLWLEYYKLIDEKLLDFSPKQLSLNQKIFRFIARFCPSIVFGIIYYIRRNNSILK